MKEGLVATTRPFQPKMAEIGFPLDTGESIRRREHRTDGRSNGTRQIFALHAGSCGVTCIIMPFEAFIQHV